MFEKRLKEHLEVIVKVYKDCLEEIQDAAEICRTAVRDGRTIFFCGNGGSAADSQHLAAEFVGRFLKERKGLPAVALTTDSSILTAVSNDYGYETVFERQVEAMANFDDVVVGISTSGGSANVVAALRKAREKGAFTIGLTGEEGGEVAKESDVCICVPSKVTARVQEAHILIGHLICEYVDGDYES